MTGNLGRVQWSKLGITLYDADGSFVCRIEDERDVRFLNNLITRGIQELYREAKRRKEAEGPRATVGTIEFQVEG